MQHVILARGAERACSSGVRGPFAFCLVGLVGRVPLPTVDHGVSPHTPTLCLGSRSDHQLSLDDAALYFDIFEGLFQLSRILPTHHAGRVSLIDKLNELRFRHNIVIDGVAAWEEQSWVGGKLRVGNVAFETVVPKVRCLATHANPLTGERDLQVMQMLVKEFAQQQPTFGVGMLSQAGGEIRVGDTVVRG